MRVYESVFLVAEQNVVSVLIEMQQCPGRIEHASQGKCFSNEKWVLHRISLL